MNHIAFLNRLEPVLTDLLRDRLEAGAFNSRRYTSIYYKIVGLDMDAKTIQVEVTQKKPSLQRAVFTAQELKAHTEDLFQRAFQGQPTVEGYTVEAVTVLPYETPIGDVVDAKWLSDHIETSRITIRQLAKEVELPESNVSAWANGTRAMSHATKGLFYYYFKYKNLLNTYEASLED